MSDVKFIDGFYFKLPRDKAPDFVKGRVAIKKSEFQPFFDAYDDEWMLIDLKVSKAGNSYASLNTWSPDPKKVHDKGVSDTREILDEVPDDDIPF